MEPLDEPDEGPLTVAVAAPAGFALLALANAVAILVVVPWPRGGLTMRLLHHAVDAAELLAVGLVLGAAMFAAWRWLPKRVAFALYVVASIAIAYAVLGQDLERQAAVIGGRLRTPLFVFYVLMCGAAVPAAHVIGVRLAQMRRWFLVPLVAALGGMVVNQLILRDDYPGVHSAVGGCAAVLAGAALSDRATAALSRLVVGWRRRAALLVAGAVVLALAAVPPSNELRQELFKQPGALGAWLLALTLWQVPAVPPVAPGPPWFADRSNVPPVPPTRCQGTAAAPVVVLITVDAVRADAIDDPANDARLPTFTLLKHSGAWFADTIAPGAQTAVSLTATFAGRYFSQARWKLYGDGSARFLYAADDPSPRFPELLAAGGVKTVSFPSLLFLANDFGVLRGFTEEKMVAVGRRHSLAREVIDPLLERLRRVGDVPAFFHAHLTEPHHPYDRATTEGSERQRYLAEVALADSYLARVLRLLSQRFKERGYLIVTSDHGEAFGEHRTVQHTKTLYEELLRVPLVVHGPGVVPRRIDQRVGLVDLGPTMLDLFGQPTPGTIMGQSLVPLLCGETVTLERPLAAEGRLRRALYDGDLKVIEDGRRKIVEVYDLAADPHELVNLFDTDRARAAPAVAKLRAFFDAHALSSRDPSYSVPYKP